MTPPHPFHTLGRRVDILSAVIARELRLQEIVDWLDRRINKTGGETDE